MNQTIKNLVPAPLKKMYWFLIDVPVLFFGLLRFTLNGNSSARSYQGLINCFCVTRGLSNDFFSTIISFFNRPYSFPDANGILGQLSSKDVFDISKKLKRDGYYVFPNLLPKSICDELESVARNHECIVDSDDPTAPVQKKRYDSNNPIGVRYQIPMSTLVNQAVVQKLFCDYSILSLTQAYFKAPPIVDITGLSWSTSFSPNPSVESAQYFHFDMDRIKWLKLFIYISDVGIENGPHTFVRGSHRRFQIPGDLLAKRYSRLTDEEVFQHFAKEAFIEFTGPRGTMILEDTRGLHKGKNLKKGDRLMFQIQFSNSLFGGALPKAKFSGQLLELLLKTKAQFPKIFSLVS